MQTQYQLLYRYINETTNTAITNEFDYDRTQEFYTEDHKLYYTEAKLDDFESKGGQLMYNYSSSNSTDDTDNSDKDTEPQIPDIPNPDPQTNPPDTNSGNNTGSGDDDKTAYVTKLLNEAETAREQIILNEMANANKSNNFYIYTGTSKTYHDKYVPATLGYKVSTYGLTKSVPTSQKPSSPDDYSKHFVMLGGKKLGVDGAYLVCKSQNASSYGIPYTKDVSDSTNEEQIVITDDYLADQFPFELYKSSDTSYKALYNEQPIEPEDLDSSRFVTLSGDTYLIIEKKEYEVDDPVATGKAGTASGSKSKGYTVEGTVTIQANGIKEKDSNDEGPYSTIFYNVKGKKAKLPNEIYFATEDGSSLANSSTLYGASSSTDGNVVKSAFETYIATLDSVTITLQGTSSESGAAATTNFNSKVNQLDAARKKAELSSIWGTHTKLTVYRGWKISTLESNGFKDYTTKFEITGNNITRCPIPEHYEQDGTAPYLIKDNYKKIPLSPWILHSVHNSLESGINKAKQLVAMIGINNVKLIKTVPFDQFVKIK